MDIIGKGIHECQICHQTFWQDDLRLHDFGDNRVDFVCLVPCQPSESVYEVDISMYQDYDSRDENK